MMVFGELQVRPDLCFHLITIWISGLRKLEHLLAHTHWKAYAALHGFMHAHEKMETTKLLLRLDNPRKAGSKKAQTFQDLFLVLGKKDF